MKTKTLAGIVGALSLAAGCDYYTPEGMQVKQDADGVLTAEEEKNIETALETEGYVNDALPYLPFANDFNVYADSMFRAEGLPSVRFSDDLHIYFPDNFAEEYTGNKPEMPVAFSKYSNSTLYFTRDHFLPLNYLVTFHHEAGHQLRTSPDEFPSEANKAYFVFNVYGFNKRIGSAFADFAFNNPRPLLNPNDTAKQWCQPVNEYLAGDFNKYYGYGDLLFLVMANRFDGNLEKALDKVMRAPRLWLEQAVRDTSSSYTNMCDAMIGEFTKLMQNQGFQERLEQSMLRKEMLELVSYMQFTANKSIGDYLSLDGLMPRAEWRERTISEGEAFLSRFGNNPYFRHKAVDRISEAYIGIAGEIAAGDALGSGKLWELHSIAKNVIEMNKGYPCLFDIYECPKALSEPRRHHSLAYLYATYFSTEMINAGIETHASLIAVPEDFVSRFYRTGNYHYEDNAEEAARYLPQIAFFAGDLEEDMAEIATSYMDMDAMRQHICRAVEWYKIAVEAGCSRIPDEQKKTGCAANVDPMFENSAASRVEGKRDYYDENCR